ncbi:MAG: TIGR02206 family membrane protein [Candidatus Izimaplasma sp.]|nr:TIGR02206 family membrane protein [Candidatus Izimaplasma bacterium]
MSLERFFGHDINFDLAMKPFTWQHYILILLGMLSVLGTIWIAKKISNSRFENKIKKGFAAWLLILEISYHIHYWGYGMFSVPLHICSFGVMFSIALLLTDNYRVFEILFFVGILGGLLALFIPNTLGYTYYNMRYYHFILLHMSITIVPIYYYTAYNYRIRMSSIYKTFGLFLLILPIVIIVNYIFKKNYMFIGEKPAIIARFLPDWPYYIIEFMVFAFIILHVLYYLSNFNYKRFKI